MHLSEKDQFRNDIKDTFHQNAWKTIANAALNNTTLIDWLFEFMLEGKDTLARTSSEIIRHISDKDPNIVQPYIDELIEALEKPYHAGIKRCIFRMFQKAEFNNDQSGKLLDISFRYLQNRSNPIAPRVFAMTTIYNISKKFPELLPELDATISDNLSQESAGFQNRAKKILNRTWK